MTEPVRSRWRGVPADERQAERRALLLDAAFDLLGGSGIGATTVRGVCEATRLNPRYFYESFEDLDALLVAVYDRAAIESVEVLIAAADAADVDGSGDRADELTRLRAGIGAYVRHVTEDPRRAQVIFVEGLGNEAMSRRRMQSMHEMAALIERTAAERGGPVTDPIASVAANLMVGGMAELIITWLQGKLDVSLEQLVDDTAELFLACADAAAGIAARRHRAAKRRS